MPTRNGASSNSLRSELGENPRKNSRKSEPLQKIESELDFYKTTPRNIGSKTPITGEMRAYALRVINNIVALNEYKPDPEDLSADKQRAVLEDQYKKIVMAFENVQEGRPADFKSRGYSPSFLLEGDKEGADTSWTHATSVLGFSSGLPKTNKTLDLLLGKKNSNDDLRA